METLFFNKLSLKYREPYRNYYTYQNLHGVRTTSFIFMVLNIIIRILYYALPESLTKAQNFPEFNIVNWVFIIITPLFYFISALMIRHMRKYKHATPGMWMFVFSFAVYIIICGMYSSFISTSDPSNSFTIYLIALSVVSMLITFEYYETLILLVGIEILFTIMLLHAQVSPTEMTHNQLMSAILLSGFYITSRYFFSYKASYYLQIVEIREQKTQIEKANVFKNQVLGTVAHDLRNPIAAVESLTMIMALDDIDEETEENLGMMRESCVRARNIIDDLLTAARNQNENTLNEMQRTDINICLQEAVARWKIQQGGDDIILLSNVKPAYAILNPEKFPRVIDNLLSNALKFSKNGDKVEIHLNRDKNTFIIQVKDYGLGIPQEMLPNIFDRFSGAGRTGVRGEQSTGIGLSIVRDIVNSHNGKITAQSKEGEGSLFTVVLPEAV